MKKMEMEGRGRAGSALAPLQHSKDPVIEVDAQGRSALAQSKRQIQRTWYCMYPSKDWSTSFQCAFSSGESAIVRGI